MATLIAIGYPDETSGTSAAAEATRLAADLGIQSEGIAIVRRDREGRFNVITHHELVGGRASWGMFWGLLFGVLFLVPVLGTVVGAGLGALMDRIDVSLDDSDFRDQARDMLQPGTSAVFLMVGKSAPERVVTALSPFGGTVLTWSLSEHTEAELQSELHGAAAHV